MEGDYRRWRQHVEAQTSLRPKASASFYGCLEHCAARCSVSFATPPGAICELCEKLQEGARYTLVGATYLNHAGLLHVPV